MQNSPVQRSWKSFIYSQGPALFPRCSAVLHWLLGGWGRVLVMRSRHAFFTFYSRESLIQRAFAWSISRRHWIIFCAWISKYALGSPALKRATCKCSPSIFFLVKCTMTVPQVCSATQCCTEACVFIVHWDNNKSSSLCSVRLSP